MMYTTFLLGCFLVMVGLVVEMVVSAIKSSRNCKGSCNQGRLPCDCEQRNV
jgi:hypothetical protein